MADDAGTKARLEAAVQRLETALGRVVERDGAGVSRFIQERKSGGECPLCAGGEESLIPL